MADGPLTLLDLAARSGDNVQSVVEDVTTVAPEWGIIPAVARLGTSYDVLRRTGLPSGAFRTVGDGVKMQKSTFERETKPMYIYEAQMSIGEDIVKAQTANSKATLGDILADEAMATVRGSAISFGRQFYYGTKADASGFLGIGTQVKTTGGDTDVISAGGGTGADTTSAYLVWLDANDTNPQGLHFAVGEDGTMNFGEWFKQRIDNGNGKYSMAWVNNFMFYVGLSIASARCVYQIKQIKNDGSHGLTDALGAQLLSKVPLGRRNNLRWLMNRTAAYTLQAARAGATINTGIGGNYPPMPTELQGVPITITDSLVDTETDGALA